MEKIDIVRPGRNFEYCSGEDPYLGYTLIQPAIKGIQSQNVIANAKHWVFSELYLDF
jgi:beta-glucosidase